MLLAIMVLATVSTGCFLVDACDYLSQAERQKLDEQNVVRNQGVFPKQPEAEQAEPQGQSSGGSPEEAPAEPVVDVGNAKAVQNGGTPPTWEAETSMKVTEISTYHWNDGKGKTPGTLALQSQEGKTYGPWQTTGLPGQGGVQNATWVANPNEVVPPGAYKVVDSDPASWSQNAESKGVGFTTVRAAPAQ